MNPNNYPPLPCRGCTKDCPNYANCNGTPWHKAQAPTAYKAAGLTYPVRSAE